ncbi:MAG TPA: peptidoglycan DD-metalloendopeptidase family protein [Candidatus Eisenbacteria bacterium]
MAPLARAWAPALLAALLAVATLPPGPARASGDAVADSAGTAGPPGATPAPSGGDEIEAQKRELESLKQELEDRRRLSKQLKGREKDILGQLRDTEKNLSLTVRYLKALERRRRSVVSDLGDATSELTRTAAQLTTDRRRLAWRLRETYKRGRSWDFEYVLSARSFGDLVARTYYLARIARDDRQRILLTQARRVAVQDTKTRLESRKRELDRLSAETQREQRSLAQLTAQRRDLLRKIRGDSKANEQAQAELERASKRIQSLIETLERQRLARERGAPGEMPLFGDFGKNKGRLAWPISGKIVQSFGSQRNPRFGTVTFNSGIDIAAAFGAPIAAVARGRVDYVNWLEGYGKCAIINHGGGFYTLYAHASEISVPVGKDVAAGETIGRVGDTGSTIGTALHFEIRRGKEALNPLDWLR